MSFSLPTPVGSRPEEEVAGLRSGWWLFLVLGLLTIVVGMIALSSTFVATLATVVVLGVLLLVAGITELIHAVLVRNFKGFAMHLLAAALYLIAGIFFLEDPLHTAVILTLLMVAIFLVAGLFRLLTAIMHRFPAWEWVALVGVVDLILAFLIWRGWPESSLWVIGMFVGIDLLLHGWAWVILGLTLKRAQTPTV